MGWVGERGRRDLGLGVEALPLLRLGWLAFGWMGLGVGVEGSMYGESEVFHLLCGERHVCDFVVLRVVGGCFGLGVAEQLGVDVDFGHEEVEEKFWSRDGLGARRGLVEGARKGKDRSVTAFACDSRRH